MTTEWHDINDPGYFCRPPRSDQQSQAPTLQTETEGTKKKNDEPEVKLLSASWVAGTEGFQFNKKCKLQVKAEFLTQTIRKRVSISTYVVFNNEEEDLRQTVSAMIDDNGIAEAELTLYYGETFHAALCDDPAVTCEYKAVASHPKGVKEITSEILPMPQAKKAGGAALRIRVEADTAAAETFDDLFRLYSTEPEKSYDVTLTVKDDMTPGDKSIDLEFTGLNPDLNYTLEIDPGKEGASFHLFENVPYAELTNG